jgi:hypothetical protein
MKCVFLVMVVSMLVTLGFAQTPDAGGNADPANVKGCLGGSDGNYTVVEDSTGQLFKITTSSVDLKAHLGHDVKLTGHKATGAVSSGAADHSFAVTELSMISEHCAAAVAAPAATVTPSPETVIPPAAAAAAPATASAPAADVTAPSAPVNPPSAIATAPPVDAATPAATVSPSAATTSTPAVDVAVPAATVSPSSATVSTPAVEAAAPTTTVSPSSATVTSPAVEATPAPRPSAHARKLAGKQAAAATVSPTTVSPSSDNVTPSPQDAARPATTAASSPQTVSPPDAAAPAPAPTVTHRAGSLTLLISFVVLVIVLGTLAPLIGRWRKRKMLERNGTPNLSFTNDASTNEVTSDQDKPESRKVA